MNASQQPATVAEATSEFLHDFLLAPSRHSPGSPAVIEPAQRGATSVTTYAELRSLVCAYARELDALGLEIGSRVILEAEATADSIALLLACSRAGVRPAPPSACWCGSPSPRRTSRAGSARTATSAPSSATA